jgi:hypothetical protein
MKYGVFNRIQKANDKVCKGNICHPMTQETLHIKIIYEDNAHHYLHIKGIVHFEFIPKGQTVNQAYYVEMLQ